jgi:hypothetical protein
MKQRDMKVFLESLRKLLQRYNLEFHHSPTFSWSDFDEKKDSYRSAKNKITLYHLTHAHKDLCRAVEYTWGKQIEARKKESK